MITIYLLLGKLILITWLIIVGIVLKIVCDRKKELNIIKAINEEVKTVKEEIKRLKKKTNKY